MKKLAAFLLIFATWYFAGMHQRGPMLATMICAVVVVLVSFVISRVLKGNISADIPQQNNFAFKGAQTPFIFHVSNKSRLPAKHFRLSFFMKYHSDKHKDRKKLFGSAGGRSDDKNNLSEFYFTAPYCGLIDVCLSRIRVYDYFRLFSASKRIRNVSYQVCVLPYPKNVRIDMPYLTSSIGEPNAETVTSSSGDDYSEIRIVREYKDGDLMRHIHRNFSARTGKLWVKEYYRDNDRKISVYLDTSSEKPMTPSRFDAFCELVSSVLTAMSKYGLCMRILWLDSKTCQPCEFELRTPDDVPTLLSRMYKTDTRCKPENFYSVFPSTENGMVLSSSLDWIFGGKPVFRFDEQNIGAQLESRVFGLGR